MKLSFQQVRDRTLYGAGVCSLVYEFIIAPAVFGKQPELQIVALGFGALGLPQFLAKDEGKK